MNIPKERNFFRKSVDFIVKCARSAKYYAINDSRPFRKSFAKNSVKSGEAALKGLKNAYIISASKNKIGKAVRYGVIGPALVFGLHTYLQNEHKKDEKDHFKNSVFEIMKSMDTKTEDERNYLIDMGQSANRAAEAYAPALTDDNMREILVRKQFYKACYFSELAKQFAESEIRNKSMAAENAETLKARDKTQAVNDSIAEITERKTACRILAEQSIDSLVNIIKDNGWNIYSVDELGRPQITQGPKSIILGDLNAAAHIIGDAGKGFYRHTRNLFGNNPD